MKGSSDARRFDAIVVEAALGGLASAAILANRGWRVAVVDAIVIGDAREERRSLARTGPPGGDDPERYSGQVVEPRLLVDHLAPPGWSHYCLFFLFHLEK